MVPAEVEEVEVGGDGSCEGRSDRDGVRREHHVVLQDQDVGKFPALGVAESGEVREETTKATDGAGVPVLGVEVARLGERARLAFREGRTVHAGNPCESGGGGKVEGPEVGEELGFAGGATGEVDVRHVEEDVDGGHGDEGRAGWR